MFQVAALLALAIAGVRGQGVGTLTAETHPSLTWQSCTSSGCTTVQGSIVLDANWRWVHNSAGTNCYTGNAWSSTICPDPTTCVKACQVDGANYSGTYGITTSGSSIQMNFLTQGSGLNVGSRVYLLDTSSTYKLFKVLNREFTFDVNVKNLDCGLNGAVYFSAMDADGGLSKYPNNKAGAAYGTGYCDSQCPRDLKFINGAANTQNWTATSTNSGNGMYGSCCGEMDLWEANSVSAAYTPHPCGGAIGQTECTGDQCGATSSNRYAGFCDPDGCDFNSYRQGNTSFYGPGKTIDTGSTFTIVTQFITNDGTDTGSLSEIRRFYVQNGVVVPNSQSTVSGVTGNSITDSYCSAQKTAFGDQNIFSTNGGLKGMGQSLAQGGVLVMSLWDDHSANMLWLDSTYPTTASPSAPGVARGTCSTSSGNPTTLESSDTSASVTYSNIKFGTLGSTFKAPGGGGNPPPVSSSSTRGGSGPTTTTARQTTSTPVTPPKTTTTTSASGGGGGTVAHYGQCGGQGYTGATTCASPYKCVVSNPYYSQCL